MPHGYDDFNSYWLKEGQLLGLRMKVNGKAQPVWYRVNGREYADYPFTFPAAVAAGASSGWLDIVVSATNSRYVLDPTRDNVINHIFPGIWLTNMILFYQYPLNRDRNALIGNRTVDANGFGGFRGRTSPYWAPDPRTELFTLRNLRPAFNIFNNTPAIQTPQIILHSMMYDVDGPFPTGHPAVGDQNHVYQLLDEGKARIYTIYGTDPVDAPDNIVSRLTANSTEITIPVSSNGNSSRLI